MSNNLQNVTLAGDEAQTLPFPWVFMAATLRLGLDNLVRKGNTAIRKTDLPLLPSKHGGRGAIDNDAIHLFRYQTALIRVTQVF